MKALPLVACTLSLCFAAAPAAFSVPELADSAKYSREEQVSINVYSKASPAVVTLRAGRGSGSGSIIDAQGLVLTNAHVVQNARNGRVVAVTAAGKRYQGQTIAVDRRNDLALVKLQTRDRLPTIAIASSSNIRVGQEVYAIGSPFGLSGTLTTGILSRIAPNGDLQTDAAINQGNSGGPLLNSRGELIGVNKAILSPGGRGNIGIGFATSADAVKTFIARSRDRRNPNPNITRSPRRQSSPPRLGVEVTPDLVIHAVQRNSLAARIGLRPGDRIVAINRRRVTTVLDLLSFLETQPRSAQLTIARHRRLATVTVDF